MFQCFKCGQLTFEGLLCTCDNASENNANVFYNHVLAYCQSVLNSFSVDVVCKALDMYFTANDVNIARKLLREHFVEQLAGLDIMKYETRRSTPQRTGAIMVAQDVAEAVYKLTNEDIPPRFVTFELQKLPILRPDSACDKSLAEKVAILEKKFAKMEDWQEQKDETTQDHDRRLSLVEKEMSADSRPKGNQLKRSVTAVSPSPGPSQESRQVTTPQVPSMADVVRSNLNSANTKQSAPSKVPQSKVNRNPGSTTRQPKRIQGKANSTAVKAGLGPDRDLWIYNVDKNMADNDLKTFIENGGCTGKSKVLIRLLEPRYEDHWESKRFRLTIPLSHYENVFNEEFWPENIWLKKYWVNLKKKPTEAQGSTDKANDEQE